jgi:hypothetical protein
MSEEIAQYQCHNCEERAYDVIGGDGSEIGKCSNPDCWVVRFEANEKWYENE